MIKKLIVFIIVIVITSIPVFAENYESDSNGDEDAFNYENYLPQKIKDILSCNTEHNGTEMSFENIYQALFSYITISANKYSSLFMSLSVILIIIAVFRNINDNSNVLLSLNLLCGLCICAVLLKVFVTVNTDTVDFLTSVKEFLSVILPSFTTVNLLCGGTSLSASGVYSFAAVTSLLEVFLCGIVTPITVSLLILGFFERISPLLTNFNTVKNIKKYSIMLISFITGLMLTVISFQNILSAKADSISVKAVKFAASGFIPIIGNAIGEALRTVGSGLSYIKASVGSASAIALFFTVAPYLCELITLKFMLRFLAFFASVCGCENESGFINIGIDTLDILLSIITCVLVLSFLLIYLFFITAFGGVQYG